MPLLLDAVHVHLRSEQLVLLHTPRKSYVSCCVTYFGRVVCGRSASVIHTCIDYILIAAVYITWASMSSGRAEGCIWLRMCVMSPSIEQIQADMQSRVGKSQRLEWRVCWYWCCLNIDGTCCGKMFCICKYAFYLHQRKRIQSLVSPEMCIGWCWPRYQHINKRVCGSLLQDTKCLFRVSIELQHALWL